MPTFIEEYRGWDISFDTDAETFIVYCSAYDEEQKEKKSFAACKKYIDDFIKNNETFKPVVVCKPPSMYSGLSKITLTGIRKDKAFTYESKKGKTILSKYDERDYVIYESWMEDIFTEITDIESQIQILREKRDGIMKDRFEPKAKNLSDYKLNL